MPYTLNPEIASVSQAGCSWWLRPQARSSWVGARLHTGYRLGLLGFYRDNGKENGNYNLGFRV